MANVPRIDYKNAKTGRSFRFFQNLNATEQVVDVARATDISDSVKHQSIQAIVDITKSQVKEMVGVAAVLGGLILIKQAGKYICKRIADAVSEENETALVANGSVE